MNPALRSSFLVFLSIGALLPARAITDSAYVGMNNGTGYVMDPAFVQKDIEQDQILGIKMVRMGIGNIGGFKPTDSFNWTKRDAVIDAYVKAGIRIMGDVTPRYQVFQGANQEEWKSNWRRYIHEIMSHCKGRVSYYIIDNEPDKERRPSKKTTPEFEVELTRIAYEEAKAIDPSIMVESPPVNAPESPYLHAMMKAGVDKACDFIGIHAYGSEIRDGRFDKPWQWEKELGIRKPISISEYGTLPVWHPPGMDGYAWRSRWLSQAYVQAKRFGYTQVLLYDLDGHGQGVVWAYINSLDGSWAPQPGYETVKNGFPLQGLTDGDFEGTNDPNWDWQTYFSPDDAQAPGGVAFLTDGANAHSGKGYLSLQPARHKGDLAVREVVNKLTAGQPVTISAWVKATGGAKGRLRVMGYDTQAGTTEAAAASTGSGDWEQLHVQVTPVSTWMVIELDAQGPAGTTYWDDVTVQ